jgi:hypothetical protein
MALHIPARLRIPTREIDGASSVKRILGLLVVLGLSLSNLSPINAITFGKEVTNGGEAYPSVGVEPTLGGF